MLKYIFEESIGKLSQEVSKGLGALIERNFKLNNLEVSSREWIVLTYLVHSEKVSQTDLVIPLGKDKVAVKRLVDQMELKSWIKRETSDEDKRFNFVILTKEGQALYNLLEPIVEKSMKDALHGISEEELKATLSALSRINDNLKKSS